VPVVPMIGAMADRAARETALVKRDRPRLVACGAAALLVGLALAGCRSHDATQQSVAPTVALISSSASAGTPGPSATVGTPGPLVTPDSNPTVDAVASELDQINALINDINNAAQPSDTSPDSGE
jgi:hypothetical protein